MIRVINDSLGRALHNMLYDRLMNFCTEYTPELPGEPVVQSWLDRLYRGDNNLHIIVRLSENYSKILAHMVVDVQDVYGSKIILCHQVQSEKNSILEISEGMEYMDKLAEYIQASCIIAYVSKNAKVLEKKYGFTLSRSVMVKHPTLGNDSIDT